MSNLRVKSLPTSISLDSNTTPATSVVQKKLCSLDGSLLLFSFNPSLGAFEVIRNLVQYSLWLSRFIRFEKLKVQPGAFMSVDNSLSSKVSTKCVPSNGTTEKRARARPENFQPRTPRRRGVETQNAKAGKKGKAMIREKKQAKTGRPEAAAGHLVSNRLLLGDLLSQHQQQQQQ